MIEDMKQIRLNKNIEFDLIWDGKRVNRITRGILLEERSEGDIVIHFGTGNTEMIYRMIQSLLEFIAINGLKSEFLKFMVKQETGIKDE